MIIRKVSPLIEVRISRSALLDNVFKFQEISGKEIFPVLKSNAYGHGLIEVARILEEENAVKIICVDSYYEALVLRRGGIKIPILIIGHSSVEQMGVSRLKDVTFAVSDLGILNLITQSVITIFNRILNLAIEIDTGMHRHGIDPEEMTEVVRLLQGKKKIKVKHLFSHLADADNEKSELTARQYQIWKKVIESGYAKDFFPDVLWKHLAATSAVNLERKNYAGNAVRLGLGLYGITEGMRPVMSVISKIVSLRKIKKGDTVGYNATFMAQRDTLVATVPMGYSEGVDRRLSNCGIMEIRGKECPIIGRVSMNMTTIDVTDVNGVGIGDVVVVVSPDSEKQNSIATIAVTCKTIPYEILVHFPSHLKRVVVD